MSGLQTADRRTKQSKAEEPISRVSETSALLRPACTPMGIALSCPRSFTYQMCARGVGGVCAFRTNRTAFGLGEFLGSAGFELCTRNTQKDLIRLHRRRMADPGTPARLRACQRGERCIHRESGHHLRYRTHTLLESIRRLWSNHATCVHT